MATIERIKEFQAVENISNYALEKAVGVSNGYLNKCKNPTAEVLENILAKYPRLSAEWLLRGEGEMYRELPMEDVTARIESALKDESLTAKILEQINLEEMVREEVRKILKKDA